MEYRESIWEGCRRLDFTFEGRDAVVVCPEVAAKKHDGKKWIFKTEYFGAFPDLELEMCKLGYHIAYLKNTNRWGLREDLDAKHRFCEFLSEEFGFSKKCVPVGMSCGGLFAIKLAGLYPDSVSALYLDAPVVNILSLIGFGTGVADPAPMEAEVYRCLGTNKSEIISYRDHPLDHLPTLIEKRIPACLVYGNADDVVPHPENAELIKKAYGGTDIPFLYFEKDGVGHHPHALQGLTDTQREAVKSFIIQNDK